VKQREPIDVRGYVFGLSVPFETRQHPRGRHGWKGTLQRPCTELVTTIYVLCRAGRYLPARCANALGRKRARARQDLSSARRRDATAPDCRAQSPCGFAARTRDAILATVGGFVMSTIRDRGPTFRYGCSTAVAARSRRFALGDNQ
jgi:hypothetical protein